MGASYSTTYVKETIENFMNLQSPDVRIKLVKRYEPHLGKTAGYTMLKMYLKKYVDAIEFVHKNPEKLPEKINEIMDIRLYIQRFYIDYYKVSPSFSYRTKYTDIEDQIDKRMNNFGRKRRSSLTRKSFRSLQKASGEKASGLSLKSSDIEGITSGITGYGRKRRSNKKRRVYKK